LGYSDDREQIKELKYLRKVLGDVDQNIPVPDSVRGAALRRRLDSITPAAPAAPNKKGGVSFGLHWFNLHSGLTYAAAFALIIGLFYGLGFHQPPEIIVREIPVTQEEELFDEFAFFGIDESGPGSAAPAVPEAATAEFAVPDTAPQDNIATGGGGSSEPPAGPSPRSSEPAMGGGGPAAPLGGQDGYSYTWRRNDPSDPDKGAYPITVDIVLDAGAAVVCQIDIEDMNAVEEAYFAGDTMTLVGPGDGRVVLRSYDISDPPAPLEQAVLSQPGVYLGSRLYQELVHVASYTEDVGQADCEVELLPGAVYESACVISALDTASGENSQKAFQGAAADVSLFNMRGFISYRGVPMDTDIPVDADADAEQSYVQHVAQIVLDGLDITISSVS